MGRVKQSKKEVNYIVPALCKREFVPHLSDWWDTLCKDHNIYPRIITTLYTFEFFREFQKTKNPEFLGKAINANSYLLEHPTIRGQIIIWIFESGQLRSNVETREGIAKFVKGLIPKATRVPNKLKNLPMTQESINKFYRIIHRMIKQGYEDFKKKHTRKPKLQADRASILKKVFENQQIDKNLSQVQEKTFNQWCDKWAQEEKEPNKIAMRVLQYLLLVDDKYEIGIKELRKFTSSLEKTKKS